MSKQKKSKIKAATVITGHSNADFDALGAMVAAGKLYQDVALIFPGSQEKNLKDFFIQSATYLFNFQSFKDIDPEAVETLVAVDTRQRSRLKHVEPLLDRDSVQVHTYDHHPDTDDDIPADHSVVKPWGSTTAIIMQEIMERGIEVTQDEATIMGLGLYEDTGSFTFSSTTSHDLTAAAWLRDRGMDLNIIADLVKQDLSAEQVALLNTLLDSASTHDINGVEVVIAEISTDRYVGDFAVLVHKMVDMENLRVIFALGRMQDRIHVVARSRTPEVDVGQICSSLGGGGHPYAASATVKEKTLAQVKDELFGLLYSHINPQILVTSLMSGPAVTVQEDTTIAQASEIMTRYGLKAVPVVDGASGECTGILEHQLADKAVSHGLGDVQVGEYMMRDITSVSPETDLYPVMEIILGQRQRLVPVISDEKIVGVITRTDLINSLVKEPARIPDSLLPERKRERQITALMRERLPKEIFALLQEAGRLAAKRGITVYAVGGFVRDILLYRPNLDLDLVVEDDGIDFARELSRKLDGRVRAHKKFRTAVVILPDGQRIDVATARLEYYEHPAALPTVELSSIKMDLFRRDFTINALALELNPDSFGRLVDFFGGQKDIKDRNIRVLHSLSFVEDPTRILRAIRFEQRFTFRIGGQTERLIKNAVKLNMFHKLSGSRVFQELKLILEEKNPLACLVRMEKFGVLQSIHPLLKLDPTKERILQEMDKVISWYRLLYLEQHLEAWMVYFLGLCAGFDPAQVRILARRLAFTKKLERSFISLRGDIDKAVEKLHRWQHANGPMSELYFIMEKLPLEGVLYLMGRSQKESLRKSISQYLTQLRGQRLDISGDDLKRLGFEPGPEFSRILDEILAAKIDGLASDRQSQLELAKAIRQQQDSQGDSLVIDG